MPNDGTQTNRWLGDLTMDLHLGRKPSRNLPPLPWSLGGSQNHKGEAASVSLAISGSGPLAEKALDQALERMRNTQTLCHGQVAAGKSELLTDSHVPIWVRLMASMHSTASDRRNRSPKNAELFRLTLAWWGQFAWLCRRLLVPSGPRENQIVGLGARFKSGQNEVRDIAFWYVTTGSGVPGAEKRERFWNNTLRFQDTFGCHLVRELAEKGAFEGLVEHEPLALSVDYRVERDERGHVSTGAGLQDAPTLCSVRYEDGEIGTAEAQNSPQSVSSSDS